MTIERTTQTIDKNGDHVWRCQRASPARTTVEASEIQSPAVDVLEGAGTLGKTKGSGDGLDEPIVVPVAIARDNGVIYGQKKANVVRRTAVLAMAEGVDVTHGKVTLAHMKTHFVDKLGKAHVFINASGESKLGLVITSAHDEGIRRVGSFYRLTTCYLRSREASGDNHNYITGNLNFNTGQIAIGLEEWERIDRPTTLTSSGKLAVYGLIVPKQSASSDVAEDGDNGQSGNNKRAAAKSASKGRSSARSCACNMANNQ